MIQIGTQPPRPASVIPMAGQHLKKVAALINQGATPEQAQALALAGMADAMQQQGGGITTAHACQIGSKREHRALFITQTKKCSVTVACDGTVGLVDQILNQDVNGFFSVATNDIYFDADVKPYKAKVKGRVLAGLAARWDVAIGHHYTRISGGAVEYHLWPKDAVDQIKQILGLVTVTMHPDSSEEPWMTNQELNIFGEQGRMLDGALLQGARFRTKDAHLELQAPETIADWAPHTDVPDLKIQATLTLYGLFVNASVFPKGFLIDTRKAVEDDGDDE